MTLPEKLTLLLNEGNEDLSNVEARNWRHSDFLPLDKVDLHHILINEHCELRIKEQK